VAINATSTAEVFNVIEILIFIRTFPEVLQTCLQHSNRIAVPFKAAVPSGSNKNEGPANLGID
jgi:hypothetical protein